MSETNSGKAAATIYCSNCGVEAKAIAKFCFACGEAIYRGPSIEALPRSQAEPAPPLPAEEAGTTQPSLDEALEYTDEALEYTDEALEYQEQSASSNTNVVADQLDIVGAVAIVTCFVFLVLFFLFN